MNPTMMLASFLVSGLTFLSAHHAVAQDTAPSIEELIKQLDSTDFEVREHATRQLLQRGPAALPQLRKALEHPSAEVRRRVQELVSELEIARLVAPKTITLQGDPQRLAVVAREIEKQTGYKLEFAEKEGAQQVTLPMKAVPFWHAVERIREQSGLVVTVPPFHTKLHLNREKPGTHLFVAFDGAFRVEADHCHEDHDIDFTDVEPGRYRGKHDHLLTMTLSVLAEPRFVILGVKPTVVEIASDENGKALKTPTLSDKPKTALDLRYQCADAQYQYFAQLYLRRTSTEAKTISKLRGVVPVFVAVDRKPVVATENFLQSKGTEFKISGYQMKVQLVGRNEDGGCYFDIQIPKPEEDIDLYWEDRIHLEDARGNRYKPTGVGLSRSGDDYSILGTFSKPAEMAVGPPTRLIMEDWTTVHYPIRFELRNIPLP